MLPVKCRNLQKVLKGDVMAVFKWIQQVRKYFFVLILCGAGSSKAYNTTRSLKANQAPLELRGIQIDEKLGASIDLSLEFYDENSQSAPLEKYWSSNKPVLLTLIYYKCPNLCQLHLNGLAKALDELRMEDEFEFTAVSFDHTENPSLAQAKKTNYLRQLKRSTGRNWRFLTGAQENIQQLSRQVGFKFKWSEEQKQYAHLPVAYVLTPEGRISRYLYGVEMDVKTLKLSLVEASQGRIGGMINRILLFCFQFDPRKNKYTLYAYNIMKAGGALTVLLILLLLAPAWLRTRNKDSHL